MTRKSYVHTNVYQQNWCYTIYLLGEDLWHFKAKRKFTTVVSTYCTGWYDRCRPTGIKEMRGKSYQWNNCMAEWYAAACWIINIIKSNAWNWLKFGNRCLSLVDSVTAIPPVIGILVFEFLNFENRTLAQVVVTVIFKQWVHWTSSDFQWSPEWSNLLYSKIFSRFVLYV